MSEERLKAAKKTMVGCTSKKWAVALPPLLWNDNVVCVCVVN